MKEDVVDAIESVLFVGLGNMGAPMARNLVRAGFTVTVADLDVAKVAALVDDGAIAATSLNDAAAHTDVVMTALPGPAQVEMVGRDLFAALRPGSLWIDLSTNDLACARRLEAAASTASVHLLDAPVTGGAEGADAATLSVLVGGDSASHQRALPLLESIGGRHDLLGPYGAGYVAKIASVSLCYLHSVCLTEALLLGVKGGVDPARMLDVIQHSTGRSYVADRYGPEILSGRYDDTFALELAVKDLRLASEMAATVGAELAFTERVLDLYGSTVETFGGAAPHLRYLNIGGGLGIDYERVGEELPSPADLINTIRPQLLAGGLTVIMEPGRSLVGNAGALVSRVIGVKTNGSTRFIVTDGSMSELIRPALYDAYMYIAATEPGGETGVFDVVGPVCESSDFLGKGRSLPLPAEGSGLAVMDAGAYCHVMASNYNMKRLPTEVLVDGDEWRIVRKGQTYEDLMLGYEGLDV